MALNKSKGNMYPWCTHTWNPIGGCENDCSYCYMKAMGKRLKKDMLFPELRWDYLQDDLGSGNTIFVGSSGDMWGDWSYAQWIMDVLDHCREYPDNTYHVQSKVTGRFYPFRDRFPPKVIIGTTVETNLHSEICKISNAPPVSDRIEGMKDIRRAFPGATIMVSVEPVMRFANGFARTLLCMEPDFVSIGAVTGYGGLPEPSVGELRALIDELEQFTEVRLKDNLGRLLDG